MLSALVLAFGLAMDATAVCAARALSAGAARERVILPLLFGAFQAAMAALGWIGGNWARAYIAEWDHWIAGGLLLAIALHMAYETYQHDDEVPKVGTPLLYLALAIATSIDAAAAGLTLSVIPAEPWLVLTLIGVVTCVCCAVGYIAARALGTKLGPRLGYVGALVLAGMAIDILIRQP